MSTYYNDRGLPILVLKTPISVDLGLFKPNICGLVQNKF